MKYVSYKLIPALVGIVFCAAGFAATATNTEHASDTTKVKTAVPPSARPSSEDIIGLSLSGDFTFWTAAQSGMALATTNVGGHTGTAAVMMSGQPTTVNTTVHGTVYYPKTNWKPGFKVDLGYNLDHDGWALLAEYTWFYNKKNHLHTWTNTDNNMYTMWRLDSTSYTPTWVNSISSKWSNWFNRINVEIARSFYAGHYFSHSPFIGVLGAWEKQTLFVACTPSHTISGDDVYGENAYAFHNKQTWWGVGPYFGINSNFYLSNSCCTCGDMSLFIDMGSALTWSRFEITKKVVNTGNYIVAFPKNKFWNVSPMLEMFAGLNWESWFADNTWFVNMKLGWETQVWFNHNYMTASTPTMDTPVGGMYSMSGLTAKLMVLF